MSYIVTDLRAFRKEFAGRGRYPRMETTSNSAKQT